MILLLAIILHQTHSLGIAINDKPKCLYLQLNESDVVTLKYVTNGNPQVLLFDPFNMQIEIVHRNFTFTTLYQGKHRVCFKNLDQTEIIVHFDFDKHGLDQNYASKKDLIDTKLALNLIDSDFRWIQLLQRETYDKENGLNKLLNSVITNIRGSLVLKLGVFLAIGVIQTIIMKKYIQRDYELIQ